MKNIQENFLSNFLRLESAGGILLIFAAVLAIILANSPLQSYYALLINTPVEIKIGALEIAKPLLLWINDGLMVVFFFMIGLELKREFIEGELSNKKNIILPGFAALGGMLVPALIYIYLNIDDDTALRGWAIPTATDIAFALGVLSLLGSKVPTSLKVFLTSLAIFDDVGAIIIIAIFYTSKISITSLIIVLCCLPILLWINKRNPSSTSVYIMVGVVMWVAMLKSGVHATLVGIILAMFIPMRSKTDPNYSPVKRMERDLHSLVAFFVLPVFAFANAGVNFTGVGTEQILHSVPLGIALGLLLGKQVGVFGFCWLAVKLKFTQLPNDMSWMSLYGTAALCGIGFTMSLFIGSLSFEETSVNLLFDERLGILLGSFISGVIGYLVLRKTLLSENNS